MSYFSIYCSIDLIGLISANLVLVLSFQGSKSVQSSDD